VHTYQARLSEVEMDPGRFSKVPEGGFDKMTEYQRDVFEVVRMWDASVIVDNERIIKLVRKCLADARV
jgi:hypothetical protein